MGKHRFSNPLGVHVKLIEPKITRYEKVKLTFKDKPCQEMTREQKRLIKKLGVWPPGFIRSDDSLQISYSFEIDCWNDVDKQLEYIEKLIDGGLILEAVSQEMEHAKCLIQDLFVKLERIEGKYIETQPILSKAEIRKSKKRTEERLKEDTERVGFTRGSLYQKPNGGYGIAWEPADGDLIRIISEED